MYYLRVITYSMSLKKSFERVLSKIIDYVYVPAIFLFDNACYHLKALGRIVQLK